MAPTPQPGSTVGLAGPTKPPASNAAQSGILYCILVSVAAYQIGQFVVTTLTATLVLTVFTCLIFWKRRVWVSKGYGRYVLGALALFLLLGAVKHDEDHQQAVIAEKSRAQQTKEHLDHLAWNRAHPAEIARRARAKQIAFEKQFAADKLKWARDARAQAGADRDYAEEHPSEDVVESRTKEAAAEFAAKYPNNPLIMDIRVNPNDLTMAVVVFDKAAYDNESDSLQSLTTSALNDQWETIFDKHHLPGIASEHLGYAFNSTFDSR